MTVEEILNYREQSYRKEEEMWRELLSEEYPIGSVVEIDGQMMKVIDYGFVNGLACVKFEFAVPETRTKFLFDLPKFMRWDKR